MLKAGDRISDKYTLKHQIGAGAMGVVWAAVNELTSREIALKLVLRSTDELRRRLIKEARICGSLSHRNIIEVLDVGQTEGGDPFLVMPLLTGETLADLLERQRRLDPPAAAEVARDIARALEVAHAAGIIHRDLKPANIFLHREADVEGLNVKVLDFGVSKSLSAQDTMLTSAAVAGGGVGSPAYMSPEQMRVDVTLDHRSDIWSLGVVLFEMLTGVRPFQGETQQVVQRVLTGEIPSVSDLVRFVEPDLVALVSRCLERDRGRRFGSATELVQALQRFIREPRRDSVNTPLRLSSSSSSPSPSFASAGASPQRAEVEAGSPASREAAPGVADGIDEATVPYRPAMLANVVQQRGQASAQNGSAAAPGGGGPGQPRWPKTLLMGMHSPVASAERVTAGAPPVSGARPVAKGAFGTYIINPEGSRSSASAPVHDRTALLPRPSLESLAAPAAQGRGAARPPRRPVLFLAGGAMALVVTLLIVFVAVRAFSPSNTPASVPSASAPSAPGSTSLPLAPSSSARAETPASPSIAPPESIPAVPLGTPAPSPAPSGLPAASASPSSPAIVPTAKASAAPGSAKPAASPAKTTKKPAPPPKAPGNEIFRSPIFE